jgi:hypothetical protein
MAATADVVASAEVVVGAAAVAARLSFLCKASSISMARHSPPGAMVKPAHQD